MSRFMDIVGWVTGETPQSVGFLPASPSSVIRAADRTLGLAPTQQELLDDLRISMASELGCTSFAIYDVDYLKGVLWPTSLSSGDHSRIRPVDLMSHHNLRRAIEAQACLIYSSAVLVEEFPALVSAYIPVVKNGRTERVVVMFDLREPIDATTRKEIELRYIVSELVARTSLVPANPSVLHL